MSDSSQIGNLIAGGLCAASLLVWWLLLVRRLRGRSPLESVPREPCPWHPAAIAFALPVTIFVQVVVLSPLPKADVPTLEHVRWSCAAMLLQVPLLMGLIALAAPIRARDFGLGTGPLVRDALVGCLGVVASWLPVLAASLMMLELGLKSEQDVHSYFQILKREPGPATIAWIGLSAVVLAPLTEELLYRVVLQGWLETRMAPRSAILFVAALFAMIHGYPDVLPLFPLALMLGYVYYRRHSYPAVVAMHALFNATYLTLALLWEK